MYAAIAIAFFALSYSVGSTTRLLIICIILGFILISIYLYINVC